MSLKEERGTVRNIPTGRRDDIPSDLKDLNREQNESQLSKRIDSYASYEVMSSLIFGFAVNVMFETIQSDKFKESYALEITFSVLMGLVLISNVYTMLVMSLTHFYVNRNVADGKLAMARTYLSMYHSYRTVARTSFGWGLIFFLIAMIIYLYTQLRILTSIITTVILGLGVILILFTSYTMDNPHKFADENTIGQLSFTKMFKT